LHRSIAALRLAVGAVLLGAARAALAYAADYANTRVAFGQPIAQYQGVAFPLVEVDIEVDATRLLLWRAAAAVESTTDLDVIVGRTSEVVARCQRTALEAGRIGVNTLGGSVDRKGRRGVSIDFDLNLGARALLSDVRDWALAEGRAIARQCDDAHVVPDEVASRVLKTCPLDTSPLLGVDVDFGVDKEFALGERDGSNTLGVRFSELAAYGDMSLILLLKGSGIGGRVVDLLGTDEQIDKWSGGLDRGEYHSTGFALTEPSCGSDATALTTTVVRDGDNWVLNGSKVFCSNGNAADFIIVFATVDRTLGHKGIRAFVVPRSTPGLSVPRPNEEKLGVRSMVTSQLVLDDVVLPLDHCLGDPGREDGFRTAMNTLNSTRPHATSFAVGIGQAAHDYAREHLTARRSEFTATRWDRIDNELRRMNAALDRGRLMVGRAAWLMDQGISNLREASQAKAYACPLAEHICVRAMVLMGADGYSKEHLVEKWYRDIKIMDIWEGAGNIQKLVVSRQLQRGGPSRF
jgi:alkylation response protein AidB-like acyl-CoA dehydrogenase